jgi:S1-C subfamily serine protease
VAGDAWSKTLEGVVRAVVVLKVTQTRAFDTEAAGSSYATGFVVDKERGLILTNRHVVTPGGWGSGQWGLNCMHADDTAV